MTSIPEDPAARADAWVRRLAPRVAAPGVQRRDVLLVTGPWLAGVSSLAAALRRRLPDRVVVEPADLPADAAPTAVIFVVSAAAALTDSDCALLDAAAARTELVIGVVAKIDLHRHWQAMLQHAADKLSAHAPRYRHVSWVGAAAAPDDTRIDELISAIRKLDDAPARADVQYRNRLRAWEFQLRTAAAAVGRDAATAGRPARAAELREQRGAAVRRRRLTRSERANALRSRLGQARVQLSHFARNRCNSVRGELQEDAAGLVRPRLAAFESYVRRRVDEVMTEVEEGAAGQLAVVARELGFAGPQPGAAPPTAQVTAPALVSGRPEAQLMMLMGAGVGAGVALTLSRLVANVAPGPTTAGAVGCAVIGLAVTVWVVRTRGLLRDRALLDRWVAEVIAGLRSATEELVALRVLAAESQFGAELAEHNENEAAALADRIAALDAELREHAAAEARSRALRGRELPALQRALAAVRTELSEVNAPAAPR